jgi:acylphosphatase
MTEMGDTGQRSIKTIRVIVQGRVQGVWYRAWTVQEAQARRLDGWVRNRRDGTVEALFSGPREVVNEMLELCWQGPPSAKVMEVKVVPAPIPDQLGFRQMATL